MERDRFLDRVTSSLRAATLPVVDGPGTTPAVFFDDPIARFVEEARMVDATVERVAPSGAFVAVAAVMEANATSRFLAWDGLDEFVPGWNESVQGAGYQRIDATVRTGPSDRKEDHVRVGEVRVGITSADVAIAASGSVVLSHGPGRPRSASLLVDNHVVLLPAERIVSSLAEGVARVADDDTSNVAIVTGPSRTGDIDSILTLGVHGPRYVHIIVIE